jgi:hypothetical protein
MPSHGATYTRIVQVHPRIAGRAIEPRYSIPEAASFIGRPTSTVRRWAVGNVRKRLGTAATAVDEPLIEPDGVLHGPIPLSFLNVLELRFLAAYRSRVPLQSIRRALDFAASELDVERPLLSLKFKAQGRSLFLQWASKSDRYLMNASLQGQLAWPSALDEFIASVDYDEEEDSAFRWWPLGREEPVIVDTALNGGIPSTAYSGVRTNAIAVHRGEGLEIPEIADDVGASEDEVLAALRFEHVAA